MNDLILTTGYDADSTVVSNTFIDTYMPQANGEFVKVYLYLLRCVLSRKNNISVSSLADTFNQTDNDIMRALRYWDKVGAIALHFDSTNTYLSGIEFCDLAHDGVSSITNNDNNNVQQTRNIKPVDNTTVDYVAVTSSHENNVTNITPITVESNASVRQISQYTPKQIQQLKTQDDFSMMLYAISAYMGSALKSSEVSTIAYFYDTLHFPSDLIEFLFEYCVSKNHKNMRYIETVALAWADAGVQSVKDAKDELSNHNNTVYSVMNAFGISNRDPGQLERDYISKWTDVYCFETDIIIEACNRTLRATHQPSFEYADSILTKWNAASVKNAEDIRKADAYYEMSKSTKYPANKTSGKPASANGSNNRFNNFHQRDTDIDSLESSLLSNNG